MLEHYTELGSGYSVALRDLELRGAGNLLGADQSGFANQIGMDAYMRLLHKTVERLRKGETVESWPDPDVSLPGGALLPDDYVSDSSQKLHLYRRLSKVEAPSEVGAIRDELVDRYGPLPEEAARLLDATLLRVLGRPLGVERILVRERSARVTFREGVIPKLTLLEGPLAKRQAHAEILRMSPLSVQLERVGSEPIMETLTVALETLRSARSAAA